MKNLFKNKKAQSVGEVILVAIGIIVALTMLVGGITSGYGDLMDKRTSTNQTLTLRSDQATTLNGKVITNMVVRNTTTTTLVTAANYTVTDNVILADGTLGATIRLGTGVSVGNNNTNHNLTYTWEPTTYADATSRSVIPLILIFSGLAIAIFALVPVLRNKVLDIVS